MSSYDKQVDALIRSAVSQGWRYSKAANNHHQLYAPNKHDIITLASTPSDNRGWLNAIAQMKRAGWVDPNMGPATTNLGSLLVGAVQHDTSPPSAPTTPARTVPSLIQEYMDRHSGRSIALDELAAFVRSKRPATSELTAKQECSRMASEGRIRRIGHGVYASLEYMKEPPPAPSPPPAPTPEPVILQAEAVAPTPVNDDSDIAELDAALVALAKIESVVRRNREVLKQFKALKVMLNNMGSAV